MRDLISRQTAIDAVSKYLEPYAICETIKTLLWILPSAQPEIIRCSECKYYTSVTAQCEIRGKGLYLIRGLDDFCSRAERRTDEEVKHI